MHPSPACDQNLEMLLPGKDQMAQAQALVFRMYEIGKRIDSEVKEEYGNITLFVTRESLLLFC